MMVQRKLQQKEQQETHLTNQQQVTNHMSRTHLLYSRVMPQ